MVNIQERTRISEDGTEIGQTKIAWIPELLKAFIQYDRSQDNTKELLQFVSDELRNKLTRDDLLTFEEFTKYKTHLFSNAQHEYIKTHLGKYDETYEGYIEYLQEHQNHLIPFFFRLFNAKLPLSQVHTYIVGGTGSGKSELMKNMIYDRMKRAKSAVIVIDPKGDLSREVSRWKENAENPERLVYFDPILFENKTPIINPFDLGDKSKNNIQRAIFELRQSFDQILSQIEGGFTPAMKNILGHILSIILRNGGSLGDVHRFLDKNLNADLLKQGQNSTDEQDNTFFNGEFLEKNIEVSTNGIKGRLGLLLQNQVFRDITTGSSTIDLGQAIKDKKLIVFNLSKGVLTRDYSAFYGKLIVSLILIESMRNAQNIDNPKYRPQIDLFIDEFQNYITPAVGEIVAEARAYGVRLTVATQLIGQGMEKSLERLILTNTDTKIIGWSSIENREAMSKQFGRTAKELEVKKRKFWVKIADGTPLKVKTSIRLVGDNNAMTAEQWERVKEYQAKYYRPIVKKEKPKTVGTIPEPPQDDKEPKQTNQKFKMKMDL
jgi:hypothetical protein